MLLGIAVRKVANF